MSERFPSRNGNASEPGYITSKRDITAGRSDMHGQIYRARWGRISILFVGQSSLSLFGLVVVFHLDFSGVPSVRFPESTKSEIIQ